MKKVLLYYRYLGGTLGGGEYLPLAFAAELQKKCQVTLALDWTDNLKSVAKTLGVDIDFSRIEVVKLANGGYHNTTSAFEGLCRFRRLRRIAANADICISLANIMDFGRPAHHFIFTLDLGDPAFDEYVLKQPAPPLFRRLKRAIANWMIRPMLGMRSKKSIITDPRMHIYPNSRYVQTMISGFYGEFVGEVFYPPTLFTTTHKNIVRYGLKVVYIGRISPEKRIKDIIEIVGKARNISGMELILSVVGPLCDKVFRSELEHMASTRPWLELPGGKYGEAKEEFLCSSSYAIHAMREEAFGIAITEYLKAGIIPIVPDVGGACEIVNNKDLEYSDNDHAAAILSRLVTDETFRKSMERHCMLRANLFSMQLYMTRQRELLDKIIQESRKE